jgi:hypothetical protein
MSLTCGLMATTSCSTGIIASRSGARSKRSSAQSVSPGARSSKVNASTGVKSDEPIGMRSIESRTGPSGANSSLSRPARASCGSAAMSCADEWVIAAPKPTISWCTSSGSTTTSRSSVAGSTASTGSGTMGATSAVVVLTASAVARAGVGAGVGGSEVRAGGAADGGGPPPPCCTFTIATTISTNARRASDSPIECRPGSDPSPVSRGRSVSSPHP